MNSEAERQAANVLPPAASATPGTGITWLASTTTAVARDLDPTTNPGLFERYVTLQATGDAIWIAFSSSATPVIDKTVAGGATVAAGTVTTNAFLLADGEHISVRLDQALHRYLHMQSVAGAAVLVLYPSSPKAAGRL